MSQATHSHADSILGHAPCSFLRVDSNVRIQPQGFFESRWDKTKLSVAFLHTKKWTQKKEDAVKFIINKVYNETKDSDWQMGVQFVFYDARYLKHCDVRVEFDDDDQSWSAVGKNCLEGQARGDASTHFGWDITTKYGVATVIHEFGHVLGMGHEHQHPERKIRIDDQKAFAYFAANDHWNEEDTKFNVLDVAHVPKKYIATAYDHWSVMRYALPKEILELPKQDDPDYKTLVQLYETIEEPNYTLSAQDKVALSYMYPVLVHRAIPSSGSGSTSSVSDTIVSSSSTSIVSTSTAAASVAKSLTSEKVDSNLAFPPCSYMDVPGAREQAAEPQGFFESRWDRTLLNVGFIRDKAWTPMKERVVCSIIDAVYNRTQGWRLGIGFRFVLNPAMIRLCQVRVEFDTDGASWSQVGKNCQNGMAQGAASTHFGWDITTPYGVATVIHEFGHVLGMGHEHQHPQRLLQFDEHATLDFFADPRNGGWSEETTRHNVLDLANVPPRYVTTPYDHKSVMRYALSRAILAPLPAQSDPNFAALATIYSTIETPNYVLSDTDKVALMRMYPVLNAYSFNVTPTTSVAETETKSVNVTSVNAAEDTKEPMKLLIEVKYPPPPPAPYASFPFGQPPCHPPWHDHHGHHGLMKLVLGAGLFIAGILVGRALRQ